MKPISMHAIPRNSAQFREYIIASLIAILAQLRAMKWRKRKQPLRAIALNRISIGNPRNARNILQSLIRKRNENGSS